LIVATLDTNVLISGLLFDGPPRSVLRAAVAGRFQLATSSAIIQELVDVLARPKFGLPPDYVHTASRELEEISLVVEPKQRHDVGVRDPKDQIIIGCAVETTSDYIITGNQDLLILRHFADIPIVTPASFLDLAELR